MPEDKKGQSVINQAYFICEKLDLPSEKPEHPEFRVAFGFEGQKGKKASTTFHDWVRENGQDSTTYVLMRKYGASVRVTTETKRVIEKGE